MKISPMITIGLGAGVGTIQVVLTRQYDQNIVPQLPAPWGNLSALGNILIGGVVLGLVYTGKIKKAQKFKDFLIPYGFSTLFGGIINGLLPPTIAGARQASAGCGCGAKYSTAGYGPTPYTGEHVGFQNHMAKGFGAPYASPGSDIPYNVINY